MNKKFQFNFDLYIQIITKPRVISINEGDREYQIFNLREQKKCR
jgi:hypothetical protein